MTKNSTVKGLDQKVVAPSLGIRPCSFSSWFPANRNTILNKKNTYYRFILLLKKKKQASKKVQKKDNK